MFPHYAGRVHRGATVADDNLCGTVVVVENASKSLSRHDGASVFQACLQRCDKLVADALVVPFGVIVHDIFGYRCPQVSLTERYETGRDTLDIGSPAPQYTAGFWRQDLTQRGESC